MEFEGTKVFGMENALIGMRLPMCKDFEEAKQKVSVEQNNVDLCKRLIKADEKGCGQPNSKFLRMIHVQVAVTAPLYWWKEMDTYKVGTVANSTSTMHKLASTPITKDCFEMDDFQNIGEIEVADGYFCIKESDNEFIWKQLTLYLETLRRKYNETKDTRYWKELIRLLPESWLQTRMLDLNYATLRSIYSWRRGHKLTEWRTFCYWIEGLPYSREFLTNGGSK